MMKGGRILPALAAATPALPAAGAGPVPFDGLLASGDEGSDPALFIAARYGPIPAPTRLPIAVLVYDNTHSAAELMPAVLQDHRCATIVGSTTPGAGCGHFTAKGSSFTLPNSKAKVHVPDCVRLRADGSNKRSGVVPDVLVP